ncbi:MAG: FG-GAP-like repeat-containing protein [Actinomadura sp.]
MRSLIQLVAAGGALTATLSTSLALGALASAAAAPAQPGDFNGDGFRDLAIGAPFGKVGVRTAGYVGVVYGSSSGADTSHRQVLTQNSAGVPGSAESTDQFGGAVATGDFDGDGFSDLAVGAPGEQVSGSDDPGTVTIVFGSRGGLSGTAMTIASPDTNPEAGSFSSRLVSGDFDRDGLRDLAVSAGAAAAILYGRAGLRSSTPSLTNIPIGAAVNSLGAGDVTGDGYDELVVSSTQEDADDSEIDVFRGSASGLAGAAGLGTSSGWARTPIAVGDVNGDHKADIVAGGGFGAPGGSFTLYPGGAASLDTAHASTWTQDSPGVPGTDESGDRFGAAVAVRDVNGDGFADVAVGAPGENVGRGGVTLLLGRATGLTATGAQWFNQGTPGVPGTSEQADSFAGRVALLDLTRDGRAELVAAVPGENSAAGAVTILRATASGLTATGSRTFGAATLGADGTRASFGLALPAE